MPEPVMKAMCSTCPWRHGSPAAFLRADLEERSLHESRICHSTGGSHVFEEAKPVSAEPMICRGSRNFQLQLMCGLGVIAEPTDQAWAEAWEKQQKQERQK